MLKSYSLPFFSLFASRRRRRCCRSCCCRFSASLAPFFLPFRPLGFFSSSAALSHFIPCLPCRSLSPRHSPPRCVNEKTKKSFIHFLYVQRLFISPSLCIAFAPFALAPAAIYFSHCEESWLMSIWKKSHFSLSGAKCARKYCHRKEPPGVLCSSRC